MQKKGLIKVRFSSILNRTEITSKFNNFHDIDFSRKKDYYIWN